MVLPINPVLKLNDTGSVRSSQPQPAAAHGSAWPAFGLSLFLMFLAVIPLMNHWKFQYVGPDMDAIIAGMRGEQDATFARKSLLSLTESHQPLPEMTFALQYDLKMLDSRQVQLVNLGIHLLGTLFVFLAVCAAVRRLEQSTQGAFGGELTAFVVTLLWTVHPLISETISFALHRAELLAGLFSAAMIFFHLLGGWSYRWASLAAVICFALGMLSKPTAFLMPVVALVIEYGVSNDRLVEILRRRWLAYSVYGVIMAGMTGAYFANGTLQREMISHVSWGYLNSQPAVILSYLQDSLWPTRLCPDYRWPVTESTGPSIAAIILLVLSVLCVLLPLLSRRAGTIPSVFVWLLIPRCLVGVDDAYGEYRMYLPLIALSAAIVFVLGKILSTLVVQTRTPEFVFRLISAVAVLIAFSLESTASYAEHQKFADSKSFWKSVITTTSSNPDAYSAIGYMAYGDKDLDAAALAWSKAISTSQPNDPKIGAYYLHIAKILEIKGDNDSAIAAYLEAEKSRSFAPADEMELHRRLQRLYVATYQFEKARQQLDQQVNLAKANQKTVDQRSFDDAVAKLNIEEAEFLISQNRELGRAEVIINESLDMNPRFLKAHLAKAKLKMAQGKSAETLAIYNEILEKTPKEIQARYGRTFALILEGQEQQGISELVGLVMEYPQIIDFKRQLAWYLATIAKADLRDPKTAVELAKEVCNAQRKKDSKGVEGKIDPVALNTLAAALAADGQFEVAVSVAESGRARAQELGMSELANTMDQRLELYRNNEPYIDHLKNGQMGINSGDESETLKNSTEVKGEAPAN